MLVFLDGKTSGITTVGINTTDGNITFDANSNVVVTGIITATKFVGTIEPTNLTVGGDLTIPDKIIHSGDTNTAIRFPAADTITAETNAVERVRITSDGKIGIGNIASPVNNVEIRTDAHGEGITIKSTGNTSNALTFDANRGTQGVIGVVYGRWNGTTVAQMNFVSGDDGTDKNDGYITFGTESAASNGNVNATERVRIDSNGYLIAKADIRLRRTASDNGALYFGDTNNNYIFGSDADDVITFATAGNERIRITSGGKVCINNDTALSDLHICTAGSGEEDGTLRIGGTVASLGLVLDYDQSSATVSRLSLIHI